MFHSKGILRYDPKAAAATRKGEMMWWMKLDVHWSIMNYYQSLVRKATGMNLNFPMWGAHITVNRGEVPKRKTLWNAHEGETIDFEYDSDVQMSDKYCWLRVSSPRLEEIRRELGLPPRPRVALHCTIANFKNTAELKRKQIPYVIFPWEEEYYVDAETKLYKVKV